MTPAVRAIIEEVAAASGVAPRRITGKDRLPAAVYARIETVKRLVAAGYTQAEVSRAIKKDSGMISFYLGKRIGRLPKPPRWRKPRIRALQEPWVERQPKPKPRPKEPSPRRYLIPYAGAGYDYVWKERRHG